MKTQAEIIHALNTKVFDDMFGFGDDILISALNKENAAIVLQKNLADEPWDDVSDEASQLKLASDYLAFAIDKADNHRGLSASRSVTKLQAWAWLLSDNPNLVAEMEADYKNYGAPALRVFAHAMKFEWPSVAENLSINRMADGFMCCDNCDQGCS